MPKENKHVAKFRESHLKPGESIKAFSYGYKGKPMGKGSEQQKFGALIITNERAVFFRKGFLGETFESIPINNISAVDVSGGIVNHDVRIATSNKDLSFRSTEKELFNNCTEAIENLRGQQKKETSRQPDNIDQLERLAALRDSGVLTEEEFSEKKKQILSTN
jgi:hypothetical protein